MKLAIASVLLLASATISAQKLARVTYADSLCQTVPLSVGMTNSSPTACRSQYCINGIKMECVYGDVTQHTTYVRQKFGTRPIVINASYRANTNCAGEPLIITALRADGTCISRQRQTINANLGVLTRSYNDAQCLVMTLPSTKPPTATQNQCVNNMRTRAMPNPSLFV